MINLTHLEKQHQNIKEIIKVIVDMTEKSDYENNLMEITLHINKLAGLLNVHLLSEDEFMYPALKASEDIEIRALSESYSSEMGDLVTEFSAYKNSYNTKNKVLADIGCFIPATKAIVNKIKNRMEKEDNNLYNLISQKGI